jgi:hypothetical protein
MGLSSSALEVLGTANANPTTIDSTTIVLMSVNFMRVLLL